MATMHTNPFSFGLDISLPQPAATFGSWFSGGVYGRFSSGAAVHAYEAHGNPFAVDPWGDLPPPPPAVFGPFPAWAAADIDLAPASTAADSPRTPVYVNPFTADGGAAAVFTDVPVPWECDDDLHDGNDQPANDDNATRNNSTMPSRPQLCASYDDDDEAILRAQEENPKTRPSPDYLETTQGGRMGPEARAALVRWMSGLCRRHDIAAGTLHRAVSYADRFHSARALSDGHATERRLNLLGAAAVLVAAKYDDQAAARRLSAGNKEEVAGMERELLAALDYRLGAPTAHTFVEHFTRGSQEGEELRFRAHGFANASLLHYGCLELRPSAVAAAAVSLAMRTLRPSYRRVVTWGRELEELTGYKREDLERGVDAIRSLVPKDGGNGFEVDKFAVFYADP
ncbi:unnamed protein product [Urochloa decumbens]|uniref:Uncharacterized protein n=1 Tax=Urochloa decumbens TaxID=240449 RepID=A0ABC9CKH3_9POAL